MSNPEERAISNRFAVCKCGHEIELIGEHDIELLICPSCNRIGCWVVEDEPEDQPDWTW